MKGYLEEGVRVMKMVGMSFDGVGAEVTASSCKVKRCEDDDFGLERWTVLSPYSCGVCGSANGLDRDNGDTDHLRNSLRF